MRGKGGSDQSDTTLWGGAESNRESFGQLSKPYFGNIVSYRVSRIKIQVFSILGGGGGGPIKLTLLKGGVENLVRKLRTNFEKANFKTQ